MSRIGIFGGSFDPVHNTHLALADVALQHLKLDQLLWVPVGQPWQKARQLARAADRAAMVQLAIAHEPRFQLESCELLRTGPSYTVDTVRELRGRAGAASDAWFLIVGQDQFAQFHTWHGWEELVRMVTLAVAGRAGAAPHSNPEVAAAAGASSRVIELPLRPSSVSATGVRLRAALGQDIATMVPGAVARYIEEHGLYRGPPRS
ncbi:MAG: nicotinate (nicotinamide) nucleotide adenylyltransferase [Burkholderiaceae bacterium]